MNALPSLPSATVEFNVLHDALDAGDDPVLAAAKAVAAGRGETLDAAPGLKGKSKPELVKIAKAESVEIPEEATVPDIITAIEAARIAKLVSDTGVEAAPPAPAPIVDAPSAVAPTDTPAPNGADGD